MIVISAMFILIFTGLHESIAAQSAMNEVTTIEYFCTADSSYQKALYYAPDINGPSPLLVALHPWSSDYTNPSYVYYAQYCIDNGWIFIHPDFRGKNDNPEATGSPMAVQDIIDAVLFAESNWSVDSNRIYLAGASGGGHAALLTAGKYPGIWAGVSAWVPITDLVRWYTETKERNLKYWQDIYNSCGGDPTSDSAAFNEASKRSPINFLERAKNVLIDINAGINDGHDNFSVPVSHSLYAFNILADPDDTLRHDEINYFVTNAGVPSSLLDQAEDDSLYEDKPVLFRRSSGNARITIFDGGHEIIYNAACEWLSGQVRSDPTDIKYRNNYNHPNIILLEQNYPNPFNLSTTIEYSIPEAVNGEKSKVNLSVYDILGRKLQTLVNKAQEPGIYSIRFNLVSHAGGIYLYKLTMGTYSESRKMILLK